jgi:hypothetical protein
MTWTIPFFFLPGSSVIPWTRFLGSCHGNKLLQAHSAPVGPDSTTRSNPSYFIDWCIGAVVIVSVSGFATIPRSSVIPWTRFLDSCQIVFDD